MKKKIILLIIMFCLFIGISSVNAGSLSINGSSSVYVNSTVKVTINFNNIAGRFKITSSDSSILSGGAEDFYDNQTITLNFSAKSAGTATITVSPVGKIGDYDNEQYTGGARSLTINVKKKNTQSSIDVNKTYSKNNYLKSLSIDGYELTPAFNKDTLEYTVELEPGTEKINVNAVSEEKAARITGAGEIKISEGTNTISIVVTAENGNERTYKITANVEEKDPIEIKINNKTYRVVKKRELLTLKDGYKETSININNFEIPAMHNEVTDVTLVGLKDEEGNINLFSYNSKTGEYKEYKEFTFDLMNLYIHDTKDTKYKKVSIKINDVGVTAYKLEGIEDYYLIYGTNTSTGYEGYYLYDMKENSIQRYDTTLLDRLTNEKDKYLTMVIVLSCVCFLSMLFLLIELNRYNKKKNEV
ncbi:MAG: cadherin-like beta sandwich domain-containing protein [Firmicutes bacterium]|nr:cadherin-like beta sandwich domain-containing protein [Bacillota bacterium]